MCQLWLLGAGESIIATDTDLNVGLYAQVDPNMNSNNRRPISFGIWVGDEITRGPVCR